MRGEQLVKQRRIEVPKLRHSVKGTHCLLNVAGVCTDNYASQHETVVACHAPSEIKGAGIKSDDFCVVAGCHDCHAELDGRTNKMELDAETKNFYWMRGMQRQWRAWWQAGIITCNGLNQ